MASTGSIIFSYDGKQVPCRGGAEQARGLRTIDDVEKAAQEVLELPQGTFDVFDAYGQLRQPEDLQRAIRMAHAGKADCNLEVKEHFAFKKIKKIEQQLNLQVAKEIKLEADMANAQTDNRFDDKIEVLKKELIGMINALEAKLATEIKPIEELLSSRTQLRNEVGALQEKVGAINLQELREISEKCVTLREEVGSSTKRVEAIESEFRRDKDQMQSDIKRNTEEVTELSKYFSGKIDVCIQADGDLKRDLQLTSERMQLLNDDLRLNQDSLRDLKMRTTGALEESEELRTLMGSVREDNEHLRNECGQVRTRMHCIEGAATEQWEGFAPEVLYFRRFHTSAKGADVQLSSDLSVATGRGFLAATGVVIGTDEGLCVGDGPCRRFGTPGTWSSYFEIEMDEICKADAGSGGIYVGVSLQSGEEIAAHPKREFDGWLVGGSGKALICRASSDKSTDDLPPPSALQPAAFASDSASSATQKSAEAIKKLRQALPAKAKGEVRECDGSWNSDALRPPDRIGILFKCHRDGGARLRVLVNGKVQCSHEFIDAPPAEAMGFVTPVLRLAGSGKSAKLLPGLSPPARALAD
jgi:hypothetical protein